ncbi:MAG: TonB-dependent receptor [Acidobacteriia bacterium]|nr:TonB-dependent receptor [Terriglobia bacterium]
MVRAVAKPALFSLPLILFFASIAAAQAPTTGGLTGTVKDPSGAVVPGAEVKAKNARTGSEFRAVANETGVWTIPAVPSGNYAVTVNAPGFLTATVKEISVDAGAQAPVNFTLEIGLRNEVVVTASKFEEEVVNAPAAATVIPQETMRDSPSKNVAEVLRSVPGMNVIQASARQFSVTSRSASGVLPSSQLVLIDGRTIYIDYLGAADWEFVPTGLDEIDQVEVIRGPASAVWGTYALNGVVNIVTKRPREMLGTTLSLGMGTFDRSGGAADSNRGSQYYLSAAHAQALNDRWAFKITAGASTQDAFAQPQGAIPNPYLTPYPPYPNAGATQSKLNVRLDHDLPDGKQHYTFAGGYAAGSGIYYSGMGPSKADASDKAGYGKADYVRGALRVTGYVNTFSARDTYLLFVDPAGQPLRWQPRAQIYHVEFGNSRMLGAKHLISYGGSFRHMEVKAPQMPGVRRHDEGGAYFQDEILLSDHFRWVTGVRIDKFDNLKGAILSPRTTFMIKPTAGQTFRISYNRAYVAPWTQLNYFQDTGMSGIDLGLIDPQLAGNYFSFPLRVSGNGDLKEQSLNAYEVGYTAMVARGRASLGAAFYVNDSKGDFYWLQTVSYASDNPPPGWPLPPFVLDALIAANAMGPGKGLPALIATQNAGKVRNKGLELSADVRLNRYLGGSANYSWQAKPVANEIGLWGINLQPAHRFNAGLNLDYKRHLGRVSVGYVGSAYWNDVINTIYSGPTKAYTVVNASGGISWRAGKYMTMLKVSNVANSPIQNHVWGDILKRQISGELRVRF